MQLRVNAQTRDVPDDVDPRTPLLFVLRNDLGLKGAKLGCGLEQCGACSVLVDGEPRFACTLAVGDSVGHEITTLEGIGTRAAPHPLQRAFLDENAAQCGYCTAGILVAAVALLDRCPDPSVADIEAALGDHLCRCGAHPRVVRAIQRAARAASTASVEP